MIDIIRIAQKGFFLSFNKNQKSQSEKDYSFVNLVAVMRSDRTQIWNAVELYKRIIFFGLAFLIFIKIRKANPKKIILL